MVRQNGLIFDNGIVRGPSKVRCKHSGYGCINFAAFAFRFMDAMDEFLGKDCGESNFRLHVVLARLITFKLS